MLIWFLFFLFLIRYADRRQRASHVCVCVSPQRRWSWMHASLLAQPVTEYGKWIRATGYMLRRRILSTRTCYPNAKPMFPRVHNRIITHFGCHFIHTLHTVCAPYNTMPTANTKYKFFPTTQWNFRSARRILNDYDSLSAAFRAIITFNISMNLNTNRIQKFPFICSAGWI